MGSKEEFNASVSQACQTRNTLQSLLVRLPQAEKEERLILENSIAPAFTSYKNQVRRLEEIAEGERQAVTARESSRREKEVSILKTDLSLIENGLKTKQLQMHAIQSPQELLDIERLGDSVHNLLLSTQATYDILRDDNRYLTQIKHRTDWEAVELSALTRKAQTLTDATSEKCMVYVIIALAVFLVLQLVLL